MLSDLSIMASANERGPPAVANLTGSSSSSSRKSRSASCDVSPFSGEETIIEHSSHKPLVFYGSWFCPYVQRVWIALEEKGEPYQYVEINPYKEISEGYTKIALSIEEKRAKYPDFIAASPDGLVPALFYQHDDAHGQPHSDYVYDSLVCVEYINEIFSSSSASSPSSSPLPLRGCNGNNLMSGSPADRAYMRSWVQFVNEKIIPHFYKMLMSPDLILREQAKDIVCTGLERFAKAMKPFISEDRAYFMGDSFSIVDLALAPWMQRLLSVGAHYRGFELPKAAASAVVLTATSSAAVSHDKVEEVGKEMDPFHRLRLWYASVRARPSFAKTVVDETRLINNYAGYADNSATSDAAKKFRTV